MRKPSTIPAKSQNPKIQYFRGDDGAKFGFLEFWIFGIAEKSKIPKIPKSKLRSTISSKILDFWIFGFTGNCDFWHGCITLLFPDAVSTLSVRVLIADLAHDDTVEAVKILDFIAASSISRSLNSYQCQCSYLSCVNISLSIRIRICGVSINIRASSNES